MRPVENRLLRLMAEMPFLDRLDMAAMLGRSRGSVYAGVRKLEDQGLAAAVPHATDPVPPARRFHLTVAGLKQLAHHEGMSLDELFGSFPVSAHWRRLLLGRLDAVAVIYRLASTVSIVVHPINLRWYRAMPVDAVVALPDGRTVGIVRQGRTSDRTGFAKRLWRLREGSLPGALLFLMPDDVRLRHAGRLLAGLPVPALLALEQDAVLADEDDPVWRLPSTGAAMDLRSGLARAVPGSVLPAERPLDWAALPEDLVPGASGQDVPDHMLPALLKPAEKRALDLLHDWPWITGKDLAGLLGVSGPRVSQLVSSLERFGLATRVHAAGRRLALTGAGIALLARRDRTSVGVARRRWSVTPTDLQSPLDWRNVSGRRSRQLLRNVEHTAAVHAFVAALARQARSLGWELVQLDPPLRAARYFRHGDSLRSVHPDAFGVLCKGSGTQPFFLEWERRAVRPTTMADRLAPYLRYFSSHRPTDDHGVQPSVLVVFHEDLAAAHFLRVAGQEMDRARVQVPLLVSHRTLLERVGPLGRAWCTTPGSEPGHAFHSSATFDAGAAGR